MTACSTIAEAPSSLMISSAVLIGGPRRIDPQRFFARIWFLQSVDLRLQQACRHEMAIAPRQVFGDEVAAPAKVDKPHFRPITDDDLTIGPLQRGASDDPRLLLGALSVNPRGHALKPRTAVRIVQRNAGVHLCDVRRGVKRVALLEGPAQPHRQLVRDR